jgi:hypothetical protein
MQRTSVRRYGASAESRSGGFGRRTVIEQLACERPRSTWYRLFFFRLRSGCLAARDWLLDGLGDGVAVAAVGAVELRGGTLAVGFDGAGAAPGAPGTVPEMTL